jgi:preprotein translocase SecE subunit
MNKSPHFIAGVLNFFRDSFQEYRQVAWPTPQERVRYFKVVVLLIVLCTVVLAALGAFFRESLLFTRKTLQQSYPELQFSSNTPVNKKAADIVSGFL